jgi:hypothetical protein
MGPQDIESAANAKLKLIVPILAEHKSLTSGSNRPDDLWEAKRRW